MLIAKMKSPSDVILIHQEIPIPNNCEVLIEVISCGVCGGDLNNREKYSYFGHEMAGIVTKLGNNVTRLNIGDRVVVESTGACGRCSQCKNGRADLCETVVPTAFKGFAEFAVVPENNCLKLPNDITYKQAAILEPLAVAIDLVKTADIQFGDHILIYGTGTIGLMALSLAKRNGATKVYAVLRSHSKKKAELARKFGADEIIFSDKCNITNHAYAKGGVDKVLVTAQNKVIPQALQLLNYGGTVAFLGFGGESKITIDANDFHVRKLQLKASFAKPGIYIPLAIEAVRTGVIDTEAMISHTMPLTQISELMREIGCHKEEAVKGVMLQS